MSILNEDEFTPLDEQLEKLIPHISGSTAELIEKEIIRAKKKHGVRRFNSRHEGYAVLLEEVDELKEVVWKDLSLDQLREEAVQVAAMAIRIINELSY